MFMDIAVAVGTERFYDYLNAFGIGRKTGIDMLGEVAGMMIKRENVKTVDLARIGFGQAIATTHIELLSAIGSVVNGGSVMRPYLMSYAADSNGRIAARNHPVELRRSITADTSKQMNEILRSVVSEGSGKAAGVNGYNIGGKTGTAQKYVNGIIAQGKYVSSFIGYYPTDNPRYLMVFAVDEPGTGVYYGSLVAAPYAGQIFSDIITYKNYLPSNPIEHDEQFTMPDLRGMRFTEAEQLLKGMGIYSEVIGEEGFVRYQLPAPGSTVTRKNIALLEIW